MIVWRCDGTFFASLYFFVESLPNRSYFILGQNAIAASSFAGTVTE